MMSEAVVQEVYEKIRYSLKRLEEIVRRTPLVVAILGAGPCAKAASDLTACDNCSLKDKKKCRFYRRLLIKRMLNKMRIFALLPEELKMKYPYMEKIVLATPEIDLIFIFPESPGSIAEFVQFIDSLCSDIVKKMRVLVPYNYHPFMKAFSKSFLSQLYALFAAVHGHLYPYEDVNVEHQPPGLGLLLSPYEVIRRIVEHYRAAKYMASLK